MKMRLNEHQAPHLKLVADNTIPLVDQLFDEKKAGQLSLFPAKDDDFLVFLDMRGVSGHDFSDFLEKSRPAVAWDLRTVPEFSFAGMSREKFFHLKAKLNLSYRDLGGEIDVSEFNKDDFLLVLKQIDSSSVPKGPYLFIYDHRRFDYSYLDEISSYMRGKNLIKNVFVNSPSAKRRTES
ncbi:hypothetical protein [Thalassospira tepidiphila]|jgi:hypothetical protein|uniref:hypothetical protein n=1 Tax=Thalassospira tepidiphila TaxID=393657 RepID=UPI001BCEFC43|nr:hypothetical protein [Thalassospira tepidiphila]